MTFVITGDTREAGAVTAEPAAGVDVDVGTAGPGAAARPSSSAT
ncbi:hypothetical protein [Streptomyces sp. NPDC047061]